MRESLVFGEGLRYTLRISSEEEHIPALTELTAEMEHPGYQICLSFSSSPRLSLEKTEFIAPFLERTLTSYRGSAFSLPAACSGFRWSAAVQAMAVLLLRHAAAQESSFLLEGESGSLAASLDYALSKQPAWLLDMFGLTLQGYSGARMLIQRTNPERKRPGPVRLSIAPRTLRPRDVTVYHESGLQRDPESLLQMADAIEEGYGHVSQRSPRARVAAVNTGGDSWSSQAVKSNARSGESPPRNDDFTRLRTLYLDEVYAGLSQTSVFDRRSYRKRVSAIQKDDALRRRNSKFSLDTLVDEKLFGMPGIGVGGELSLKKPLRVTIPCAEASTTLLFLYLKLVKKLPVEVHHRYPHSLKISEAMQQDYFVERYDAAVLSLAAGAAYLSSCKTMFRPLMLLPTISYTFCAPPRHSAKRLPPKKFLLIPGNASHTQVLYERFNGTSSTSSITEGFSLAFEVIDALYESEGDTRAILWFPYNRMLYRSPQVNRAHRMELGFEIRDELMLFFRADGEEATADGEALAVALRGAWVHLLHDRALMERLIDYQLSQRGYRNELRRMLT